MPGDERHDQAEDTENEIRRDDVLERQFGRGDEHDADIWATRERERQEDRQRRLARDDELWHIRALAYQQAASLTSRVTEQAQISAQDRDGLRFRDAALHSTAVGGIEEEIEENALAEDAPADKPAPA